MVASSCKINTYFSSILMNALIQTSPSYTYVDQLGWVWFKIHVISLPETCNERQWANQYWSAQISLIFPCLIPAKWCCARVLINLAVYILYQTLSQCVLHASQGDICWFNAWWCFQRQWTWFAINVMSWNNLTLFIRLCLKYNCWFVNCVWK